MLIFLIIILLVKSYFFFIDMFVNKKIVNVIYILVAFAMLYLFVLLAIYANSAKT